MLICKFERQTAVPFDDRAGTQRRPVVVMPHQPIETRFFDQLLLALNTPSAGHFIRGFALQEPAVRLLQELGTRVVVIDELNSLLTGTARQQRVFLRSCASFPTSCASRSWLSGCPRRAMRCCPTASSAAASPISSCRHGLWATICGTSSPG
jgi:hypothetical protein